MPSYLGVSESRRSRSKSPGGRERDRSHSRDTRAKSPPKEYKRSSKKYESSSSSESEDSRGHRERRSSKKYYEEDKEDDRRRSKKSSKKYEESESEESDRHRRSSKAKKKYDSDSDDRRRKEKDRSYREKSKKLSKEEEESEESEDISISIRRKSHTKEVKPENGRHGSYSQPPPPVSYPTQYPPDPRQAYPETRHMSYVDPRDPRYAPPPPLYPPGHSDIPDPHRTHSVSGPTTARYAEVDRYQYAQPAPRAAYREPEERDPKKQYIKTYNDRGEAQYVEVAAETRTERRPEKKYRDERHGSDTLTTTASRLAVGGALGAATLGIARQSSHDGGRPPASPLLEAYKGTYQSISPMPGALVLAKHGKHDDDLSDLDLSPSESEDDELRRKIKRLEREKERHRSDRERGLEEVYDGRKETLTIRPSRDRKESDASVTIIEPASSRSTRKAVSFYDPTSDAKKIAAALQGTNNPPKVKVLINILPGLSTDDLLALRLEYKSHAKVNNQGINIAKHIKTRVPGNLGKIAYATALGRWESEAYWANSWYQGGASRRELLIESLMGRSNSDIREIKNCFKDKRYNDDLEKCMRAELKADKFRTAILLALEENRMPDSQALDIRLVQDDVQNLHRALSAPSGGETAMISIIVVRSDAHLREVLRVYERTYTTNFARAMIERSKNLVGETLAHILNGALNRPMRDALLLHQAISETAPGKERAELLISRVVRLHWEPKHLEKVKGEYAKRYGVRLETAVREDVYERMKTEEGRGWAEFCIELVKSSSG